MMFGEEAPLQQGIAAVKANNYDIAKKQLIRAISEDPKNAAPWFWLSVTAATLDERIQYLEQAVLLQPNNQRALKLLETLRSQLVDNWIQQGISAVKAGDNQSGQYLLTKAVNADETRIEAWWWLGQINIPVEEKLICFENILTLNPEHTEAQQALYAIRQLGIASPGGVTFKTEKTDDENQENELACRKSTHQGIVFVTGQEENSYSLDSALSCPFCAAPTLEKDVKCPQCNQSLIQRQRPISQTKPLYKTLIGVEGSLLFSGILIPLLLLTYTDMIIKSGSIFTILNKYLNPETVFLPVENAILFSVLPKLTLISAFIPFFLTIFILGCVLSRWHPLYFTAIGLDAIRILVTILNIILAVNINTAHPGLSQQTATVDKFIDFTRYGLIGINGIIGLLSATSFILLTNLSDHFVLKQTRRLLLINRDVMNSDLGMRLRSRAYGKEKAWALSALHARQSLLIHQEIEGYILLATAYYHLGFYEKMANTLAEGLSISPDNAQLLYLHQKLPEKTWQQSTTIVPA